MRLTALQIEQLPIPEKGQKTYWENGFGVRVSQGGSKSFVVMYGEERRLRTLGKYPTMSLKMARQAAMSAKLSDTPQARLNSLSEARSAFLKDCETRLRQATINQYTFYLDKTDETLLSKVNRHTVTDHTPHCIASWKVFFNWAIRNELVEKNPFAFVPVKYKSRSRVLTSDEVRSIWQYDYPPYSDYLKLLLLTGQRRGQFQHFEVQGDTIYFPASIMKGKVEHVIPASPLVLDILGRLQPFNGWSKAKVRADKYIGVTGWTLHDCRRYFSTINAAIGTPIHVTEKILAHSSGTISGVSAIYNRHSYLTEMRTALDSYQKQLQTILA